MTTLQRLRNEGIKLGEERGIKLGKQEGAKQEKVQIAKNLLQQGADINLIKRATGLTSQWLGRLKNELAKENKK